MTRKAKSALRERLLENVQAALELLVGRRQRRQQSDHVAVEPARKQQESVLARLRRYCLRHLARLLGELNCQHRAEAPDLADLAVLLVDPLQPAADQTADRLGSRAEARVSQGIEHHTGRRAPDPGAAG